MSGMAEPILEELSGRVLTLTINRPERLNAIDYDTALLLGEALERAESDASVSAVILTGAGERAFCAGQDLKSLAESGKSALVRGGWGGVTERSFSKPLIAAVNGLALGGGMELALSCDITLASETAHFALPEVRRGLFPVGGGAVRLARTLPRSEALRLLLTGAELDAGEALRLGLVSAVTPPCGLLPAAMELARQISENAPLSVKYAKRLYYAALDMPLHEAFLLGDSIKTIIASSEDAKEGPAAFAQKRRPVWKGR